MKDPNLIWKGASTFTRFPKFEKFFESSLELFFRSCSILAPSVGRDRPQLNQPQTQQGPQKCSLHYTCHSSFPTF